MGSIMVALQKSIMEQTDIVPILQSYLFKVENDKLYVENPVKVLYTNITDK
jgi:hypothetical protein